MMKRVDRFVKLTTTRGDMQITLTDPKSKEVRSLVIYIFPAGRQWEWMRLVRIWAKYNKEEYKYDPF